MIGRKPELVCIGAQKAATTWFHRVCQARSDIWVPPFKEVHFFDHKFCPENRRWIEAGLVRGVERAAARHRKNAKEKRKEPPDPDYLAYLDSLLEQPAFNGTWYKRVFSRAPNRLMCLDVTPEYSTLPEDGVDFLAQFLKESRFIYILRDPADRAVSQLRMNLTRRKIEPKTPQAWMKYAKDPVIANRGDYKTYVPRWRARFSDLNLLFLAYGDVRARPRDVMRTFEAFAGLDREDPWGLTRVVHKGGTLEVPDSVRAYFEETFADQTRFIADEFGADFAARI
ncbi:MAG: sulfotransferase [Pseudomonadota bacterium]